MASVEDLLKLTLYNNQALVRLDPDILHTYKYNESFSPSHSYVQNISDSLISTSEDTLTITDVEVTNKVIVTTAPSSNNAATGPNPCRSVINISFEATNVPTGLYTVGGPKITSKSMQVPVYLDISLEHPIVGYAQINFMCYNDSGLPQWGMFVPDIGAFGIIDTNHTVTGHSLYTEEDILIESVEPAYYNDVNGQPMTGNWIICSYGYNSSTFQISPAALNPSIGFPTYCRIPIPILVEYVSLFKAVMDDSIIFDGQIHNSVVNIIGTNLMTLYSNTILTDLDRAALQAQIDTLASNDLYIAEALDNITKIVSSSLDALQASINDLRDKIAGPGFDAHSMIDNVASALDAAAVFVVEPSVKLGLAALSTIMKMGNRILKFYKSSSKMITGPEGRILNFAQGLTSVVLKLKSMQYTAPQFKTIIQNLNNRIGNTSYKWTRWRHYIIDLQLLGNAAKYVNYITGWPIEALFKQNLYPKHSLIIVNEVTSEGSEDVPKWISFSRTDKVESIQSLSFTDAENSFIYRWTGSWEDSPQGFINQIGGRDMYELQQGAASCDFDDAVRIIEYAHATLSPYNLFTNNCHDSVSVIIEYLKNGILPVQIKQNEVFTTEYNYS